MVAGGRGGGVNQYGGFVPPFGGQMQIPGGHQVRRLGPGNMQGMQGGPNQPRGGRPMGPGQQGGPRGAPAGGLRQGGGMQGGMGPGGPMPGRGPGQQMRQQGGMRQGMPPQGQMMMGHMPGQMMPPMQPQPMPLSEPLDTEAMANADPVDQKNMIGEKLYPLIYQENDKLAGKITGMLLEMDNSELLNLIEDKTALLSKIEEAMNVLKQHSVDVQGTE
jgi:polyadenylate-binding protein